MRIALLGTRGIPANYGGFETFAEELSIRLVERGHDVTVYGRQPILEPAAARSRAGDTPCEDDAGDAPTTTTFVFDGTRYVRKK